MIRIFWNNIFEFTWKEAAVAKITSPNQHSLERLGKFTRDVNQDSEISVRDLNYGTPNTEQGIQISLLPPS
jgi:hypothetical protein